MYFFFPGKLRKVVHKNKVLIMCKEKTEIYPLIEFITTVATIPLVVHDGISRKSLSGMLSVIRREKWWLSQT